MNRQDGFLWSIVAQGAANRLLGRPRDQNPYCPGQDSTEAREYGWDKSAWSMEIRGVDEVRRWLREAV